MKNSGYKSWLLKASFRTTRIQSEPPLLKLIKYACTALVRLVLSRVQVLQIPLTNTFLCSLFHKPHPHMPTPSHSSLIPLMHPHTPHVSHITLTHLTEGVVEIWLTSEDLGAYGHDIGVTLPELLWQLVDVVPKGCMLRLGMTNPPYIMEHLEVRSLFSYVDLGHVRSVMPNQSCLKTPPSTTHTHTHGWIHACTYLHRRWLVSSPTPGSTHSSTFLCSVGQTWCWQI